ncbi:PilZ domain-containing protein [Fontivita pretiosa]|uniref:PilZ domain-containing protein n=1 Tax=Fontivita pretiosa TaxID=2989684 RepID=UPI003D17AF5F
MPQTIEAAARAQVEHDRRRSPREPRHQIGLFVVHHPDGPRQTLVAAVRDISREGIGIESCEPLEVNDLFLYRADGPDGVEVSLLYRVVRCQPSCCGQADQWTIGGELVSVAPTEETIAEQLHIARLRRAILR